MNVLELMPEKQTSLFFPMFSFAFSNFSSREKEEEKEEERNVFELLKCRGGKIRG